MLTIRAILALLVAGCASGGARPAAPDAAPDTAAAPPPDAPVSPDAAPTPDATDAAASCGDPLVPAAWASWPMPPPASQRYQLAGDVVIDTVTRLEWQRAVSGEMRSWNEAGRACACLRLDGKDDWRLPSRIELVSLADYTRANPSIDGTIFPATPSEWFWSASPQADSDPPTAWYVAFFDGNSHSAELDTDYHVRCVRGPATTDRPRYTVNADTVTDPGTGLTWQRRPDDRPRTFAEASAYCRALPLAGGGWRLPDMRQLQTLIDESRRDPAIDPAAFPATPPEGFWAGHRLVETAGFAWFVSFEKGIAYNSPETQLYHVRCVR